MLYVATEGALGIAKYRLPKACRAHGMTLDELDPYWRVESEDIDICDPQFFQRPESLDQAGAHSPESLLLNDSSIPGFGEAGRRYRHQHTAEIGSPGFKIS